jgi:beta-lactam-binding protein with PASTA domain
MSICTIRSAGVDEILFYLRRIPVGGVLAFLGVGFLWFLSASPGATAFVPSVTGIPIQQANEVAAAHSFALKIVVRAGGGRAGTVVEQSPEPGTALPHDEPITAVVTKGVTQVRLPVVKGKAVEDVRGALQAAGVKPGIVTFRKDATVPPDHVITTDPAPGSFVDVGSTIEIIASAP